MILDIMRYARYEPAVLQIERHPYLSQEPLVKLTKRLGMAMTAYSSMGPQGYFEIGMGKNAKSLMQQDLVMKIAQSHNACKSSPSLRSDTWRSDARLLTLNSSSTSAVTMVDTAWNCGHTEDG